MTQFSSSDHSFPFYAHVMPAHFSSLHHIMTTYIIDPPTAWQFLMSISSRCNAPSEFSVGCRPNDDVFGDPLFFCWVNSFFPYFRHYVIFLPPRDGTRFLWRRTWFSFKSRIKEMYLMRLSAAILLVLTHMHFTTPFSLWLLKNMIIALEISSVISTTIRGSALFRILGFILLSICCKKRLSLVY